MKVSSSNSKGCTSSSSERKIFFSFLIFFLFLYTGTILTLGTLNITTEAQLSNWLSTVWFPRASPDEIAQILVNYPADVTQGVSILCFSIIIDIYTC